LKLRFGIGFYKLLCNPIKILSRNMISTFVFDLEIFMKSFIKYELIN
jgi:hypothetical protein